MIRLLTCSFVCLMLLAGCAATPSTQPDAPGSQAVYYPAPPAPPRLQFLTSFDDGANWSQRRSSFSDWVVGREPQSRDTSSGRIDSPYGIAARDGKVYICDVDRDIVHVVDFANQRYGTLGPRDLMDNPVNITIDADGTKYVCDTGRRVVLKFDANDQFVGELGDPNTCTPMDLAIAGDELFIVDIRDLEIEVWDRTGRTLRTLSRKGPGPDELSRPANLDVGRDGRVYVTDMLQQTVKVFNTQGRLLDTIGQRGTRVGSFARPKGIALDPDHRVVYVADSQWDVVQVFDTDGQLLMVFGEPGTLPHSTGLPACVWIDRTSLDAFRPYLDPDFEAEYLLFLTNQFGRNKVAVYAFGRSRSLDAAAYEVDRQQIERDLNERRRTTPAEP